MNRMIQYSGKYNELFVRINTTLKILKHSDTQSLTHTIARQGVLYSTSQTT